MKEDEFKRMKKVVQMDKTLLDFSQGYIQTRQEFFIHISNPEILATVNHPISHKCRISNTRKGNFFKIIMN